MKQILTYLVLFLSLGTHAQLGKLLWSDEFNDTTLDLSKWSIETGTGVNGDWGTGQLDRATDRKENIDFQQGITGADQGCLVITTRKEEYMDRSYTSGRIRTAGKAAWGPGHRIVARVRPEGVKYQGQGFAFWMMPDEIPTGYDYIMWPQGGEIDIMEYVGAIPFNNLGTVHYAWSWENNQYQSWNHGHLGAYYNYKTKEVPNPSEPDYGNFPPDPSNIYAGSKQFHSYGIDWYTNRIEFFVDDQVYHIHYFEDGGYYNLDGQDKITIQTINNKRTGVSEYSNHFKEWQPFEHNTYAILSAGVGGSVNTYGGPIVPEAIFPCSVFIDWVRVYELDESVHTNEVSKPRDVLIFPNPVNDELIIEGEHNETYRLQLINSTGSVVLNDSFRTNKTLDISSIIQGHYFLFLTWGKESISQSILKN